MVVADTSIPILYPNIEGQIQENSVFNNKTLRYSEQPEYGKLELQHRPQNASSHINP